MPVLDPIQMDEGVATETAATFLVKVYTSSSKSTLMNLDGKVVTVRFAAGSTVVAKEYTAVNRALQSTTGKGLADFTLSASHHSEDGDFLVQVFVDAVLYWEQYTVTFEQKILIVTPTPTPTPSPTPTPT